jgi:arylsulfatase A
MRFTDCHSAAPNCSPSRAGILTGRTPSRVGIYSYLPANHVMHLRDQEVTVADLLKSAGYHTGHFGKWHLSRLQTDQPQPSDQGFDYSLGTDNNAAPSHFNPTNFVRNGIPAGKIEGYSCQIVVDETIEWLDRINAGNSDKPFFACVWFHEPHTPIASPPRLIEKYKNLYPELTEKQAAYHANVENADRAVGRLMERIDELEIADDTVVFITSDNGPLNAFSSVGLRGKKSHVWEGGQRVPGIFRWPGRIGADSQCDVAISGVDYLPTVCDIAGIQPPRDRTLDGISILPLLRGNLDSFQRPKPLYWFFYRLNPSLAVRDGDWVLIANTNDAQRPKTHPLVRDDMPMIRSSKPVQFELYNLRTDRGQQNDLSTAKPEILNRLKDKAMALHRDVVQEGFDWDIPADYGAGSNRRIWTSQ